MPVEEISLTLIIIIGVLSSLFIRNGNCKHSVALNKIIFNFKIYLRDKEESLGKNVLYVFINSFII
jgi:hypothetical protein